MVQARSEVIGVGENATRSYSSSLFNTIEVRTRAVPPKIEMPWFFEQDLVMIII